jgi:hypothetical protein
MSRIRNGALWGALSGVALLFTAHSSFALNTGVSVEGVSDYSYYRSVYGASSATDIDMATEAGGFFTTMTGTAGTPWTVGHFWTDYNVWDQDIYDSDLTGNGYDDDVISFDDPVATGSGPTAIAFFGAHGICDDALSTTCSTSADCTSGQYCSANPPSSYSSRCIKLSDRYLITSSSSSTHNQYGDYSGTGVAWGEDAYSTGWAGAGTNGADSVAFVVNSCGSKEPFLWSETKPPFGGAMLINYTMPQSNVATGAWPAGIGDLVTWSNRGTVLATYALANPNSSITGAWDANLDSAPQTDGASCPDQTGTYTYGGGHGYTGCAGNLSMAWAQNQTLADWYVTSLDWTDAQDPSNKPTGNSYGYGWIHCNYDCITYGFYK